MGSFSAYMAAGSPTSAAFSASFTGGDANYSRRRYVVLTVSGAGTYTFDSDDVGGSGSTFTYGVWGLDPGTTYAWSAVMGYYGGPGATDDPTLTGYGDSGTFTTPAATGSRIWDGSAWRAATPYIWDGSQWAQATPFVFDGSAWRS